MAPKTRRSQRVILKVTVIVRGQRAGGLAFVETATTEVVNAHGAMVCLEEVVQVGQVLRIRHAASGDEEDCRVVGVTKNSEGKVEVGLEFLQRAPRFWHVAFPPEDWSVRDPEAKRFGENAARPEVVPK